MMQTLEKCMHDVESWMNGNRLKLNPNKTEFIIFSSSIQLGKCATEQINVCGTEVKKCKLICYLGAFEILMCSLVLSHLDYSGIADLVINKLQRV